MDDFQVLHKECSFESSDSKVKKISVFPATSAGFQCLQKNTRQNLLTMSTKLKCTYLLSVVFSVEVGKSYTREKWNLTSVLSQMNSFWKTGWGGHRENQQGWNEVPAPGQSSVAGEMGCPALERTESSW